MPSHRSAATHAPLRATTTTTATATAHAATNSAYGFMPLPPVAGAASIPPGRLAAVAGWLS